MYKAQPILKDVLHFSSCNKFDNKQAVQKVKPPTDLIPDKNYNSQKPLDHHPSPSPPKSPIFTQPGLLSHTNM